MHLYFDDTGSRNPDHVPQNTRRDGMDCFGFGGFLINAEDIDDFISKYKFFRATWGIDYPFHSQEIRGGRGNFGWLTRPENAGEFLPDLERLILSLPIICIAAIIHRPGYVERYSGRYGENTWMMSKTAFAVLVERSAKFAKSRDRKLRIFFEGAGPREDREVVRQVKEMKAQGMPFSQSNSGAYDGLTPEDFRELVLGEPQMKTKATPMIQIADLVLYPMAKAGYDPSYGPFRRLLKAGKLIDTHVDNASKSRLGIKYSCFPSLK
jgi:hypothetical protein